MNAAAILAPLITLAILGAVGVYLWRMRKRGAACIGCPHAKTCAGRCHGHTPPSSPPPPDKQA